MTSLAFLELCSYYALGPQTIQWAVHVEALIWWTQTPLLWWRKELSLSHERWRLTKICGESERRDNGRVNPENSLRPRHSFSVLIGMLLVWFGKYGFDSIWKKKKKKAQLNCMCSQMCHNHLGKGASLQKRCETVIISFRGGKLLDRLHWFLSCFPFSLFCQVLWYFN